MNHFFACVDLGCTKSAAVVAEMIGDQEVRVLGFGQSACRGLRKGTITDEEEATRSLLTALRKAEQMANRRVTKVYLNTSGARLSTQNTQGVVPIVPPNRLITQEDVDRALRHSKQVILPPDKYLLHAIPRWFRLDGAVRLSNPLGQKGVRLEVHTHLVVVPSQQIESLERCAQRAQVEVEHIVFSGLASALSVVTPEERAKGVAVVDLGAGGTNVAVYRDGGILGTGFVPVGSHHVTSDLSKLLNTSQEEAEHLKISAGTCYPESVSPEEVVPVRQVGTEHERPFPRQVLAEIIEARVRETLSLVKEEVEKISGREDTVKHYALTGGGSKIQGLLPLAQRVLAGAGVRLASPQVPLGAGEHMASPEFATLVGLIQFARDPKNHARPMVEAEGKKGWFLGLSALFTPKTKS